MTAATKRAYRTWTAKERSLVVRHYGPASEEPRPTDEIAGALGRTPDDVRAAARRYGRCHRHVSRPRHARMLSLYREGLDDTWVALLLGCCREHVQRWRKRNVLPANKCSWGHGTARLARHADGERSRARAGGT